MTKPPKPSKRAAPIDILTAMSDPNLFGQHFKNADDWASWRAFLAALFGLPMSPEQLTIFQQCTSRTTPPPSGTTEAWIIAGRRGGKSFILSTIAVYLACFRDWRQYLAAGERATIMIVAADLKQTRVILRYCEGLLRSTPMLSELITNKTRQSISLSNRVTIESHAASFRSTRGYSLIACLLDELAFWPVDENAAEPDVEILNALRPGLANIPGSMLLCASSPYARKAELWNAHRKHYGKNDSNVLVWQAATRTMNPKIPQRIVDEAIAADPASAAAEFGAVFRTDVESFVLLEAVQQCISKAIERKPEPIINYVGFCDPAGGSGTDDMSLCIAHYDYPTQTVIIDCLRWFSPPFSPEAVTREFSETLKSYNISTVYGDRYAGSWPAEQFSKFSIKYEPSSKTKSELYTDLLPLVNSARIQLLNIPKCNNQLLGLERRTARGGKDSIDHASGHHDDLINSVAGAAAVATSKQIDLAMSWVEGPNVDLAEEARAWRVARFTQHIMNHR